MKSIDTKSAPYANSNIRYLNKSQHDVYKLSKSGKFETNNVSTGYRNTQMGFHMMNDMMTNVEIKNKGFELSRKRNTSSKNLQYSYTDNDKRLDDTELISTESPEITKMNDSTTHINRKGSYKDFTRQSSTHV